MKKHLTLGGILIIVNIIFDYLFYYNLNEYPATLASLVVLIFSIAIFFYSKEEKDLEESFYDPYDLSQNDAGLIFEVTKIVDNKIGLRHVGYISEGCYGGNSRICYYWITDFPMEVRNVGMLIDVMNTKEGLVVTKREGFS